MTQWRGRGTMTIAAVTVLAVVLAGCTAAPAPAELRASAQAAFDELVTALGEADPAVVRTVEVAPVAEITCADGEGTQETRLATGTMAVAAAEGEAGDILEDLAEGLDAEVWTPLRVPEDAAGERAWISDTDIVLTLAARDPTVVVGVFTPCSDG